MNIPIRLEDFNSEDSVRLVQNLVPLADVYKSLNEFHQQLYVNCQSEEGRSVLNEVAIKLEPIKRRLADHIVRELLTFANRLD